MADLQEQTRFRSFAERYLIERATFFRQGEGELEDAWMCVERAKTLYKHIAEKSNFSLLPDAADMQAGAFVGGPSTGVHQKRNVTAAVKRNSMPPWAVDPTSTRKAKT